MSDAPLRVIKLGGSLLDWPELPAALRRWRQLQPPMRDLLIVGGGAWADLVRDAFDRYRLDEESCHWLCLRLMSVTARLAASLFPEAALGGTSLCEVIASRGAAPHSLVIVDMLPLLEEAERREGRPAVPHTWDATSDSIAAWLAMHTRAFELVLLKSQLPPPNSDCRAAAACRYVDRFFPHAAASLKQVRCVNLRDASFAETSFVSHS
jgi:aspartokinase-like uncharacterized kinase